MDKPWLVCQNGRGGRKEIFLARDEENFFVIYAYESLNWKKREVLASEGVSEQVLKKLEARYDRIPQNTIRGVSVGGCCAGDSVYLYPKDGKRRKFQLRVNHQQEQVDGFFGDMPRFEAPVDKTQEKWNDQLWRRKGRDQQTFEKCRYVPWLFSLISLLFHIGFIMNRTLGWFVGCLFSAAVPVMMTIRYPCYFTLLKGRGKKKADAWDLKVPLLIHIFVMLIMPWLNWLDGWMFLKVSVLCGILGILILLFSEEFRREKFALVVVFFVAGLAGCSAVGQINRLADDSPAREYVVVAQDVYQKSGKGTSYYCVVTIPEYGEVKLHISQALYQELDDGDPVLVVCRDGALGIEYANAYSVDSYLEQ